MGLLASVSPYVHSQGTALDEALFTPVLLTDIRSFVGMYPEMPLQVRFTVEALRTRSVIWIEVGRAVAMRMRAQGKGDIPCDSPPSHTQRGEMWARRRQVP